MSDEKIRTTIYLRKDLYEEARVQQVNLSQVINKLLEDYFSVQSIEDINRAIKEHEEAIKVLERKKQELMKKGIEESTREAIKQNARRKLMERWVKAKRWEYDDELNRAWLTGKTNEMLLKEAGMTVEEALQFLKEGKE